MWNEVLINKALFFASEKHAGQTMPHPEGTPYSVHYTGVTLNAINLASVLSDIDYNLLVCIAILHDTLEDTNTSYEELEINFGQAVAQGVLALSKNKNLPKQEQMIDCIERIKKQPKEIAIVKLADRLFNLRDKVPTWSDEKVQAYKQEGELIFKELGYVVSELSDKFDEVIQKY